MDDYSENILKGIPRDDLILGNSVNWTAFIPKNDSNNGWLESSINWEDDEGSLELLMNQVKDTGEIQFRAGVVRLPKSDVDDIINFYKIVNDFTYERDALPENPYHGNLLFSDTITKDVRNTICGALSRAVSLLIKRT